MYSHIIMLYMSLDAQILFGSFPIARCRDPYAVLGYLAAHAWPRLQIALGLRKVNTEGRIPVHGADKSHDGGPHEDGELISSGHSEDEPWSPLGGWMSVMQP
jgi:hypothetical protein